MLPAPNGAACSNTAAPINRLAEDYIMLKDPRSAGPRPPFPKQQQSSAFTAGLAQLVAKDGSRVNAVAPGAVWTPLIPSTMSAEKAADFGADSSSPLQLKF
jgi:hypothetical protein